MKTVFYSLVLFLSVSFNLNAQEQVDAEIPEMVEPVKTYVQLSLRNKTAQSIPLVIPGVMNPNLSPFSKSGVSLVVGQEILFKYKGKKQVLLTVSEDMDMMEVFVGELLKQRKKEIDNQE